MTQTLEPRTATRTPAQRIDDWLARFDEALSAGDATAAADLFAVDGFWRDLVAFTWNLKTLEGREQITDMLAARLADTSPSGWAASEPATETADGIAEAFVEFETAAGRGNAHLRLRPDDDGQDQAWTLLTALQELTGHEEPQG
ncbi:putative oxidoreductase, partial [Gordonia araii NBRC 100433]